MNNKNILIILVCSVSIGIAFLLTNSSSEEKKVNIDKSIQTKVDNSEAIRKELLTKAETKKEKKKESNQKVIEGYTKAYEYIYKNDMKQIVDDVQYTENNTPFTIYSDGGNIIENDVIPPSAPIDVSMKIEDEYVTFFVPSNATQIGLLVTEENEEKVIVESLQSKDDVITSPPTPQILFSNGKAEESIPDQQVLNN